MREFYKKRGETPLEALARLRAEEAGLEDEVLSYAGRLDPMAEGILPILVGAEENADRHAYLGKDKTYRASFLIGCATDTGDVLGRMAGVDFRALEAEDVRRAVRDLESIVEQAYPWYSSRTVGGVPLFKYAREGNFSVERPVHGVAITDIRDLEIVRHPGAEIISGIVRDIAAVTGDFRQAETIADWEAVSREVPETLEVVAFSLRVSSGTYVRGFSETLSAALGVPVVLYRLVRTGIL